MGRLAQIRHLALAALGGAWLQGRAGDVGIHILDFTTFGTGLSVDTIQAQLKTFKKAPKNQIGPYKLDANDSATMSVAFNNGALGVIHASRFMTGYTNTLRLHIFGDKGALECEHGSAWSTLRMVTGEDIHKPTWQEVPCPVPPTNYQNSSEPFATERMIHRTSAMQRICRTSLIFASRQRRGEG